MSQSEHDTQTSDTEAADSEHDLRDSKVPVMVKQYGYYSKMLNVYECKRKRKRTESSDDSADDETDPVLPPYGESDSENYESDSEWEQELADEKPARPRDAGVQIPQTGINELSAAEDFEDERQGEHDLANFDDKGYRRRPARQSNGAQKEQFFSANQIQAIIDQVLKEFEAKWEERTLPKLKEKAWKLWNEKKDVLESLKRELDDLKSRRLAKQVDSYTSMQTQSETAIRKACLNSEGTVEQICELKWLIGIIRDPEPPTRPELQQSDKPLKRKRGGIIKGDDDEWGDFIASEDEYPDLDQPRPKERAKREKTEESREVISLLSDSDSTPQPKAPVALSPKPCMTPEEEFETRVAAHFCEFWVPVLPAVVLRKIERRLKEVAVGSCNSKKNRKRYEYALISLYKAFLERVYGNKKYNLLSERNLENFKQFFIGRGRLEVVEKENPYESDSDDLVVVKPTGRNKVGAIFADDEEDEDVKERAPSETAETPQLLDVDADLKGPPTAGRKGKRVFKPNVPQRRSGRKNIKPILPENDETRALHDAVKRQEAEIDKRAEEQSKDMNLEKREIIINLGHSEQEEHIYIPDFLANKLKDHQVQGVQFMWKTIIMAKKQTADGLGFRYGGCILSHAMGLGKTLQTIVFIFTLMREVKKKNMIIPEHLRDGRILIVAPPALISNWKAELLKWIDKTELERVVGKIYEIDDASSRRKNIEAWFDRGGVLLAGYQRLASIYKAMRDELEKLEERKVQVFREGGNFQKLKTHERHEDIQEWLFKGASIAIFDEGHKLKNTDGVTYKAMKDLETPSKVILTGTPLQNNLGEYWAMIDYILPSYLGTLSEFSNAYKNPIENGFHADSTEGDRRLARIRMDVLKRLIAPMVQRMDISPLKKDLPKKTEFVIFCKLGDLQRELYSAYLKRIREGTTDGSIIGRSPSLLRLCAHPYIFKQEVDKQLAKDLVTASSISGDIYDQISSLPPVNDLEMEEDKAVEDVKVAAIDKNLLRSLHPLFTETYGKHEDLTNVAHSYKMRLLMDLLREAQRRDHSTLVFSKSLPTLDYIHALVKQEHFESHLIKGDVNMADRERRISAFNKSDRPAVFLISTTAGNVGVNLQRATRVVLFDLGFNPSDGEQAIARAYRYGQTKPVVVYRLLAADTYESTLYKLNVKKISLFKHIVDGKFLEKTVTKAETKEYFKLPPDEQPWDLTAETEEALRKKNDEVLTALLDNCRNSVTNILEHEEFLKEIGDEMNDEEREESRRCLEEEHQRRKRGVRCS